MKIINYPARICLLSLAILVLFTATPKAEKLNSMWRDHDITIDGMQFDWESAMYAFDQDKVNIGVMNDSNYLYICLVPLDETIIRQVIGAGFTVWLEGDGGKRNKIGIRHPVGMRIRDRQPNDEERPRFNADDRWRMAGQSLEDVQIIRPDSKDTITVATAGLIGLEVRVGLRNERMVYELKVPLSVTDDTPYAINARPGSKVKIKFETDKIKRPEGKRLSGGGPGGGSGPDGGMMPPGGGGGGSFGGPPGGGGGGRPGMGMGDRQKQPEQFKMNLDIILAKSE
jgi:uncharacterized membrane protein YgcG